MKPRYYFFIILFFGLIYSQETQSKKSVQDLITNKAYQITKEEIAKNPDLIPKPVVKKVQDKETVIKADVFTFTSVHYKMLFLLNAALIASLLVIIRRRKSELAKLKNSDLKKNIKNLRQEKIRILPDSKLVDVRKSLLNKKIKSDSNGLKITSLAKKLSVAKGEIHLAAKLNLLYEQNK